MEITFKENDFKQYFSATLTDDHWATEQGLTHVIKCGLDYQGHTVKRYGRVLKTVAYIAVDEAADGSAILEKWNIKHV